MSRDPEDPIESLQREVERLFHSQVYRRSTHFAEPSWAPPADLVVSRNSARVLFELAGVPRENVRVRLRGRTLEVSGRRVPPQEPAGAHYHRAEIYFGEFRRLVELPWEAESGKVEAIYRDGMLEVRLKRAAVHPRTEVPIEERAAAGGEPEPRELP
jgi:HSP20 family protein